MNSEQKTKIIESIIHGFFILAIILVLAIILMFHNPSALKASISIFDVSIEVDCNFYGTGDENSR